MSYGKLSYERGQWHLTNIPPHVAIRLKSLFNRIPKTAVGEFYLSDNQDICADLHWFMQRYPLAMADADRSRLSAGFGVFEQSRLDMDKILLPDWTPPSRYGFKPGYALYHSQAQDVEILHRKKRLLVLHEMGLGKSWIGLGAIVGSPYLPAAIIVPTHLADQWVNDFIKPYTYLTAHIITGTKPYKLPPANVYVFKYSNIAGWVDIANEGYFKAVIFDEVHSLRRGIETAKGRAAKVFASHAQLLTGFSGTPIFNYGAEMFHVVDMISPGILGEWGDFLREWCTPLSNGKWLVKDPNALGSYLRELQMVVRRLRQGRPVNTIVINVEHDIGVERAAGDRARMLAQKVMTGTFIERGNAARDLDMFARMVTGIAKAKSVAAYVRILLEAGKPVLLAGWHREVYKIWQKELADFKPVMYTGTESTRQKKIAKEAFTSGKTDLCFISLRAGEGLDGLQKRCSTVVVGELDWSGAVHQQLIGRVDRPGQTEDEVTAIYCVSDSGSDPTVLGVLGIKAGQARGITDPFAEVEQVYTDESRIKTLAAAYLAKQ